jgi:hypothetical protein
VIRTGPSREDGASVFVEERLVGRAEWSKHAIRRAAYLGTRALWTLPPWLSMVRFATDSLLEGAGFEPSVPLPALG